MFLVRSPLFGTSLTSMPFLDYGGICADDTVAALRLYEAAQSMAQTEGAKTLELRHRQAGDFTLPLHSSKVNKVSMILDLVSPSSEMWNRLDPKVRNQVRKAAKSGLTVGWEGESGLNDFYEVFAANMRDLGSPVHSRAFFRSIMKHFPKSAQFILVRKGGHTIAGGLSLGFKEMLCLPWASSLRECRSLCPNTLLYWEAIRWGCDNGYHQFDFGRSTQNSGSHRFKQQWGATEAQLHWQSSEGSTPSNTLQAEGTRYKWAMNLWKYLPLSITKAVGPWVRRQIAN